MEKNKYAVDLHIHSALSPCADEDMTPNNIVNMCLLKGLEIISITDHNSTANLPVFDKLCKEKGLAFLPGIEVNTKEEVHLLCYFENLDWAMKFGDLIYEKLPHVENNERIFGSQLVMDEFDRITRSIRKLLISATDLTVEEVVAHARSNHGQVIPAHLDRQSYSLIHQLGFIPKELNFKIVELSRDGNRESLVTGKYKEFPYGIIRSSDAHYLHQILERETFLELWSPTRDEILGYLGG